ncbi:MULTISPECIES: hypothetical protein [Nocardia]|uniref:hypothetical protein n=1 Tax=Nocardia TaxID=1817 RepID=UPI0007EA72E1|nr:MULTISPECIES: hypothetical protein [Nocardia]OBF74235.1 hypothetical protein A9X06_26625 [Mycobacterium sp. 852002-51759_SCH5129042]MBF6277211.1 hypothetical protein [Nocardia nova]OBA42953.1 hypothetical protein A5789_12175 [Nocardia sp. 852002-51101_SCH5132738]OBB52416.1 hypothetical protein A5748_15550 [Nocardia sp. 852002-51244_SCH5132740]PPI97741.1 hypothetical protein C5E46_14435 [Nocardia nova]
MATTAQLRAALAVLRADTDEAAEQARISEMSGTDSAAVEHALLAGLLYRMMGDDLRHSLTGAPDLTALEERARAAGPGTATYATDDREQREEHCAQAHFEAYWLAHRIAGLHFTTVPSAPALQAAAHTAEATRTLLRIHRDLLDAPDAGHPAWEVVIDQLDRARDLAFAASAGAQPPDDQPPESQPSVARPSVARPSDAAAGVSEIGVERSTECRTP